MYLETDNTFLCNIEYAKNHSPTISIYQQYYITIWKAQSFQADVVLQGISFRSVTF